MLDRAMMTALCAALFIVFCFGLFAVMARMVRSTFGF